MPVELIFETHSWSEDNEAGLATGWLPGRLSPRGWATAAELGARYHGVDLAAIYSSDLARAVETIARAFPATTIPVFQDARLRECNYGDLNGAPVAQLAPRTAYIDRPFPGGQSYRDVVAAMRSFLADIRARWDGVRVLIVAHSANKWALDCLLQGARLEDLVNVPFAWREGWTYRLD